VQLVETGRHNAWVHNLTSQKLCLVDLREHAR
jgi:hypothetical protein